MIDSAGHVKCDGCGKKLAEELKGEIAIVCPRCKHYNKFKSVKLDNYIANVLVSS